MRRVHWFVLGVDVVIIVAALVVIDRHEAVSRDLVWNWKRAEMLWMVAAVPFITFVICGAIGCVGAMMYVTFMTRLGRRPARTPFWSAAVIAYSVYTASMAYFGSQQLSP